ILTFQNHTNRPLTDFGGKTSIFSHPVYLFLREFSLQDFRGGSYIQDNQEYDLVTVKRSRGGVIRREHLKGKDISVKSQFYIKEGDFLISKRQIVHGANQWAGPCRSRRTAGSP
ncbi:hypothetical protein LAW14_03815, partial [Escherichia coli]|nr:hypothetical protein [Escherichia coli]MDD8565875.1 hypothetical protein [Escherichia coli]